MERRLITAALPYINNVPHLGHIIGSHLPADIFARFCRAKGYDVVFVGGTDENGSTSEIAAEEIGVGIGDFCDKLYEEHKKVYDWFGISYDNFSRTSREIHHKTTQDFFKTIYENGFVSKGKIKVFYSPSEGRFLPDRYVKGVCPRCGYEEANADQCEKCTAVLEGEELINPRSALTGERVEIREVEHLFLRLDKLSDDLKKWILSKKDSWRPQVTNLALGWIKEGLRERCITRDLKHGVRVPLEGFKDKVFYVWFDAPIGYISSTKEAFPDRWEDFWKKGDSRIYHFLGKDNIPFHTIFWPGMLMAHKGFNLPYNVVGLQYLNYEGGKFSKSKKHGVFCESLIKTNLNPDVMRGYLSLIIPESSDTEFKWDDFMKRVNADIIGNFANFINRSAKFGYTRFGGNVSGEIDAGFFDEIKKRIERIEEYFEKIELKNAFFEVLSLSSFGNKYFNDGEPWVFYEKDKSKAEKIIYNSLVLSQVLAVAIQPFLPNTAKKIWKQLGLEGSPEESGVWNFERGVFPKSYSLSEPKVLFEKISADFLEEFKKEVAKGVEIKDLFK